MIYVLLIHCSFMMSQLDLVSCITEKEQKKKNIVDKEVF
jgi:hypothetical protein